MIDEKKLIAEIREKIRPESFGEQCNSLDVIYAMLQLIDEQPKVGEWIPCSERLPEEDGIYIVDDRVFNSPWIHTAGFMVSSKAWCENHGVYYDDKYGRYEDGRVIAWQPLPEPWEGEGDV